MDRYRYRVIRDRKWRRMGLLSRPRKGGRALVLRLRDTRLVPPVIRQRAGIAGGQGLLVSNTFDNSGKTRIFTAVEFCDKVFHAEEKPTLDVIPRLHKCQPSTHRFPKAMGNSWLSKKFQFRDLYRPYMKFVPVRRERQNKANAWHCDAGVVF